jgi:hypothetical protein
MIHRTKIYPENLFAYIQLFLNFVFQSTFKNEFKRRLFTGIG